MSWYKNNPRLYLHEQKLIAIHPKYNTLHFCLNNGYVSLVGIMKIFAKLEDKDESLIDDEYKIIIAFPNDYPDSLPVTKEIGDRIDHIPDNHVNPPNEFFTRSLCLGTSTEMYLKFNKRKNIINYLDNLLLPFLYYTSYKEKYGREPYASRPHGNEGVFGYYKELFGIENVLNIINLLNDVISPKNNYKKKCPCGSGVRMKKCHKNILDVLSKIPGQIIKEDINSLKTLKQKK